MVTTNHTRAKAQPSIFKTINDPETSMKNQSFVTPPLPLLLGTKFQHEARDSYANPKLN